MIFHIISCRFVPNDLHSLVFGILPFYIRFMMSFLGIVVSLDAIFSNLFRYCSFSSFKRSCYVILTSAFIQQHLYFFSLHKGNVAIFLFVFNLFHVAIILSPSVRLQSGIRAITLSKTEYLNMHKAQKELKQRLDLMEKILMDFTKDEIISAYANKLKKIS